MTNYRSGPLRTATEADWGTTDLQELPGTATEGCLPDSPKPDSPK